MIEQVLNQKNLNRAYLQVYRNKGAGGVDGVKTEDLADHLANYGKKWRMGGWRVAQSPILGTTITINRLKQRGYLSFKDYYHKVRHR